MFDDLDEVLRKLLRQEIPIKNHEVDIEFDQPTREWSARLNRPTLNVYLYDVRENTKLRQSYNQRGSVDGAGSNHSVQVGRPEVRVDVHYMITVWATEPEDEHRLLARTFLALARTRELPADLLPEGLRNQPRPISVQAAQYDSLLNPTDIWSVLDNELRPAISCMFTLTVEPFAPVTVPIVRTRELRFARLGNLSFRRQPARAPIFQPSGRLSSDGAVPVAEEDREFWTVGGTVGNGAVLDKARLTLVELGLDVPIAADGRFVIGNLQAGSYTLELMADGDERVRRTIVVPSEDYDLEAREQNG